MINPRIVIALVLLVVVLCISFLIRPVELKSATVTQLKRIGHRGLDLRYRLVFYNPNFVKGSMETGHFELMLGDKEVDQMSTGFSFKVPASDTASLEGSFRTDASVVYALTGVGSDSLLTDDQLNALRQANWTWKGQFKFSLFISSKTTNF